MCHKNLTVVSFPPSDCVVGNVVDQLSCSSFRWSFDIFLRPVLHTGIAERTNGRREARGPRLAGHRCFTMGASSTRYYRLLSSLIGNNVTCVLLRFAYHSYFLDPIKERNMLNATCTVLINTNLCFVEMNLKLTAWTKGQTFHDPWHAVNKSALIFSTIILTESPLTNPK